MAAFSSGITWNSATDIPKVVKEYELEMHEQVMAESTALREGFIKSFERRGVHGTVLVNAGGNGSVRHIGDGGSRAYGGRTPVKKNYYPSILVGGLRIGRSAAHQTQDLEDGVDLVMTEAEAMKSDMGWQNAVAMYDHNLGTVNTATTANTSTTTTVSDASRFEPGMKLDVYDTSNNFVESVTITDVAYADDPGSDATITFSGGGTGGACANSWLTTHYFELGGTGNDDGYGMVSLADIASDSGAVYGLAATAGYNWRGYLNSATGRLTKAKIENMETVCWQRRKKMATCFITTKLNETRYARIEDDKLTYSQGSDLDPRGKGKLAFNGTPIVLDEAVGNSKWFRHYDEDVKVHVFLPLGVDDYRDRSINDLGRLHSAEDTHDYLLALSMERNLRCVRRSGIGLLDGITD